MELYALIPLFFLASLIYSMVGFAGGSTYSALLILLAVPYTLVPKVTLLCNIIVSLGGCYLFAKAGHLSLKKILPFVITSIPMAYWGGTIPISKKLFGLFLGVSLAVAAIRIFLNTSSSSAQAPISQLTWKKNWLVGLSIGASLGFFSGLVGIGGGIFLAPILFLLRWAHAKEIAAASSFFILVNSIAGFFGQTTKVFFQLDGAFVLPLLIAAFLGGQIGSRMGCGKLSFVRLEQVMASVVLSASLRLIYQSW